jgi:eukaryotic-like serine/threonine-protein kinase
MGFLNNKEIFGFVFLLAIAGCGGLRLPGSLRSSPNDWTTLGRTGERNPIDSYTLTPPLVKAWTVDLSAGFGRGSPVIMDSTVFVGNLRGELYALRVRDGSSFGRISLGSAIDGSPVIQGNIAIVATGYSKESLICYDLTAGKVLWSRAYGDVEATPLLVGKKLFVGTTMGQFYCVDITGGDSVWRFSLPANTQLKGIRSAAAYADSAVFFGAEDHALYALRSADGSLRWKVSTDAPVVATPVVAGHVVVAGNLHGDLFAIDRFTGRVIWKIGTHSAISGPVAITDSLVIATTIGGTAWGLRLADGSTRWQTEVGGPMSAGGVCAGEYYYCGTLRRDFVALRILDGTLVWRTTLDGRVKSAPSLGYGMVYVATDAQELLAFKGAL